MCKSFKKFPQYILFEIRSKAMGFRFNYRHWLQINSFGRKTMTSLAGKSRLLRWIKTVLFVVLFFFCILPRNFERKPSICKKNEHDITANPCCPFVEALTFVWNQNSWLIAVKHNKKHLTLEWLYFLLMNQLLQLNYPLFDAQAFLDGVSVEKKKRLCKTTCCIRRTERMLYVSPIVNKLASFWSVLLFNHLESSFNFEHWMKSSIQLLIIIIWHFHFHFSIILIKFQIFQWKTSKVSKNVANAFIDWACLSCSALALIFVGFLSVY